MPGPKRTPGSIRWQKSRDEGKKPMNSTLTADLTIRDMAPSWLCAIGKEIYRETASELVSAGVKLLSVDVHALAAFSNSIVKAKEADAIVRKEGMIVAGPRGGVFAHPAVRLADRYWSQVAAWGRELGCSPSARSRWETEDMDAAEEEARMAKLLSTPRPRRE